MAARIAHSVSITLAAVGVAVAVSPASPAHAASVPPVTISHLLGKLYPNPQNTGSFDYAQLADEQFDESFPVLDFNPPAVADVFCKGGTTANETSRPFTDVVRAPDGTCENELAVGGHWGDLQAGVADLQNFEAVFSGSLTVNQPGDITFNVFSDDGWIMWLGEEDPPVGPRTCLAPWSTSRRIRMPERSMWSAPTTN